MMGERLENQLSAGFRSGHAAGESDEEHRFVGNNVQARALAAALPEKNVLFAFALSAGHTILPKEDADFEGRNTARPACAFQADVCHLAGL